MAGDALLGSPTAKQRNGLSEFGLGAFHPQGTHSTSTRIENYPADPHGTDSGVYPSAHRTMRSADYADSAEALVPCIFCSPTVAARHPDQLPEPGAGAV